MAQGPIDPRDLGADKIVETPNADGGTHYTAYSETGGQISWDVNADGETENVHMSDRNCGGDKPTTVWHDD